MPPQTPLDGQSKSKSKNLLKILGALFILAVLVGAAYYFFGARWPIAGMKLVGSPSFACTKTVTGTAGNFTQVTYISGTVTRSDTVLNLSIKGGQTLITHSITRDGKVYSWSEGATKGVVSPLANGTVSATTSTEDMAASDCQAWALDATRFEVPPSIQFASPQS